MGWCITELGKVQITKVVSKLLVESHCPKMNEIKHRLGVSELNRRVCPRCGKYYPTLKALEAQSENIVFATNNEEPELEELRDECQEHEEIIEEVPVAETTDRLNLFDRLNRMFGI